MTDAQRTARVQRWDNPVKMYCQAQDRNRSAMSDYSGHSHSGCRNDAYWVKVNGDTVTGFYCDSHRPA